MPSPMDINGSHKDDEFSQGLILPPLVVQLKKILDQYSDDTQILKELIQNAEDAGATEVKFLYDKRTYRQDPRYLQHPELGHFQGPALCVYNDAVFSEEDWRGIRMLSQSVKHSDSFKVGRFGIGFKSVFHLTDMPSVLSGERLSYIDPHRQAFSASSHGINLSAPRVDLLATIPHQLEPFIDTFDCNSSTFRSGRYGATFFRFPLRTRPSPLSAGVYSDEKLEALLSTFAAEAHLLLLFLRNVQQISIYHREANSRTCRLAFRVAIGSDCVMDVHKKRADFIAQVKSASSDWLDRPLVSTFPLSIVAESSDVGGDAQPLRRTHRFLVTNYCCGGTVSPIFRNLRRDPELGLVPLVGAAMKLDGVEAHGTTGLDGDDRGGRLFCFLPLPSDANTQTRLPVHVNGFFVLEQNRKYVKWPGAHLASSCSESLMDKGLLWNHCLMREAVPRAYVHLLSTAVRLHSMHANVGLTVESIYHAFADPSRLDRKFESVVSTVYGEMLQRPMIFYESSESSEWIEPKLAIFNSLDPLEESTEVILRVLNASNVKMVTVPTHLLVAVRKYAHFSINQVTPSLVAAAYRDVQFTVGLHWESKMKLLRYFLRQFKYELLDGLELLPLANGGFDVFHYNPSKADRPIYIVPSAELQALLPGLKDEILELDIDEDIKNMLTKASSRGYTQLKVLDASLVGKLLPKCLPSSWLEHKGSPVEWIANSSGQPPAGWLEALWLFLVRHSPRDLTIVEGLPLLPCRTVVKEPSRGDVGGTIVELVALSSDFVCLARSMDGIALEPDVERVMRSLGVIVIDDLPDYVKSHPVVVRSYVFSPSYVGVLRAVERQCALGGRDDVISRIREDASPREKRALRELFAKVSVYEIPRSCLELLANLPLFETWSSGESLESEPQFTSVVDCGVAAPTEQLPFRISRRLISTATSDSQALAKLLGVKPMNAAQLLSQVVFPDIESAFYDNDEVKSIMLYVLRHFTYFVEVDRGLRKTLRSLPFLPKSDMLLTVDRFYDPDHELLRKLFLFEENFPPGDYGESSIVAVLREIGLHGVEDVEPEDLLESAITIQLLYQTVNRSSKAADNEDTVEKLIRKSDALLEYLHRHKSRLRASCGGRTLSAAMNNVCWVRSLSARPSFYPTALPWCSSASVFFKPGEMVVRAHINLVGSVRPVVAADVYTEVAKELGWDSPPPLVDVVSHLVNVVLSYDPCQKVLYTEMTRLIYAELSRHNPDVVGSLLSSRGVPDSWIWQGEGFASPDHVVLVQPFMDLSPFVFPLPAEMTAYSEFFSKFGVKSTCSLIEVLRDVKIKYDAVSGQRTLSKKKFPESEVKRDLHICVCVLNELKSHVDDVTQLAALQRQLYVPVHTTSRDTLKMAPLLQCSYCDEEWLRQGYSTGDLTNTVDDHVTLVHPNVPSATAEALGIPTLMSKVLEGEEFDFNFGQTDSLTHRLNALLDEYSDGFAVPKELVQNADDAGATEIRFLYDERTNSETMSCLIDDGMKECHGPALWVYNNAVFSDEDFENITKLNGATKETQTDKIGRFGLGFNVVYNLTDVPMFVSRNYVVIFDPHTTHLGKSIRDKSKPGLKLDTHRHRKKLRSFGNQFAPFNDIFGCDLRPNTRQESYPGTLFRLPLRTRSQAARSEISRRQYNDVEMKSLLRALIDSAENLLLFTQNLTTISVHHLPSTTSAVTSDMVELFRIVKRPARIVRELSPVGLPPGVELHRTLDKETLKFVGQCSILRSASDVMRRIRQGEPIERVQFPDGSMVIKFDIEVTPSGASLLTVQRRRLTQHWLVCSLMSRYESLRIALQDQTLLPTAGAAVPLQCLPTTPISFLPVPLTDSSERSVLAGAVFAYLPLPMRSGLPVHINAMFALTSNRKSLWELNEDEKFDARAAWNETLLRDVVTSAYVRLLVDLVQLSASPVRKSRINELWPRSSRIEFGILSTLTKSFYYELTVSQARQQPALFSDGVNWGCFDENLFLDCSYDRDDLKSSCLEVCRQCLTSGSIKTVILLSDWLRQEFQMVELEHVLSARTYSVVDFFAKIFLPNMDTVTHRDRDLLLMNALLSNDPDLKAVIAGFHSIPATPDGTRLRQPAKLVDPESSLSRLYLPGDARFPYGESTYAKSEVLEALRNMGMKRNARDLAWQDMIERAHSITTVEDQASAFQLSSALLAALAEKLADNTSFTGLRQIQQQLLDIPFVPATPRPKHFPLRWRQSASKRLLHKPSELFSPDCKDLVGCVHLVADETVFPKDSAELLSFLRLGLEWKEPLISQVLEQLDVLADSESHFADDSVMDEVQRMCFAVCSFLQNKLNSDLETRNIRETLADRHFVLGHNRFLSAKQIAFDFAHNCAPYLYPVPETYRRHFADLLRAVGVRDRFEINDFVSVLQTLHETVGTAELNKEQLRLSLQLVTLLNEALTDAGHTVTEVVEKFGAIYVPDSLNRLSSATELCFNEQSFMWPTSPLSAQRSSGHLGSGRDSVACTHPLIPYAMSKQLGVSTRQADVLKKHSRGIGFGQREPLTNRIKRILSGYPCDREILKELLQNADDAGASEIYFVKDPRQHGVERIFDESWRPLQGPGLCVYNNRPFTEADLTGIQQLGQGSKSLDPNKTGQYGVGFNCAYHLTDVPSFLTRGNEIGETLCVFDPHARFIPGSTVEEPGRRFDNLSQLRTVFTDVFPCYLEDIFDLHNGTMFRFPLRTEELAKTSDLSEHPVSLDEVDQLFSKFQQEIFDCLLFVNNLTSISTAEVNPSTRKLSNVYTVTVDLSDEDRSIRQAFFENLKAVNRDILSGKMTLTEIPASEAVYTITVKDNKGCREQWLISQRIGVDHTSKVPSAVVDAIRSKDIALLPRGGVAAQLDNVESKRRPCRAFCFLPLPVRTELPVHVNGHFALDHEARRNLWQDDEGGTKTEWNAMLVREVITPAYLNLVRRIVSQNVSKLECFGDEIPSLDSYARLFPVLTRQTASGYWRTLSESFYRRIHDRGFDLLPVVRYVNDLSSSSSIAAALDPAVSTLIDVEWLSTSGTSVGKPFFDNLTETFSKQSEDHRPSTSPAVRRRRSRSSAKKPHHEVLRHVLLSCGFPLVHLPLHVFESFIVAGVDIQSICPRSVIHFFSLYKTGALRQYLPALPADIASTPFGSVAALKVVHDYCSQDVAYFRSNLVGLPLLLCEDGRLRQFSTRERVFLSVHHELLPGLSSAFIHHSYVGVIFKDVDIDSCSVFRRFDIAAFAGLLLNVLSPTQYRWKIGQPAAQWNKSDVNSEASSPTERWLHLVWSFLSQEFDRLLSLQTSTTFDELSLAKALLEPLKDWCLVPAYTTKMSKLMSRRSSGIHTLSTASSASHDEIAMRYLAPLQLASTILDYSQSSIINHQVRQCFGRIGIPELDCRLLDGTPSKRTLGQPASQGTASSGLARLFVSSLEQPSAVLSALHFVLVVCSHGIKLTPDECFVILKYFCESVDLWQADTEAIKTLRSLPLHLALHGNIVGLGGSSKAFLLQGEMLNVDMENWQNRASIVLLRSSTSLTRLYHVLGCPEISSIDVYLQYVFPCFSYLSAEARLTHLEFIRDEKLPPLRGGERTRFLQGLANLAFLARPDGELRVAGEFCDPHHPVFKAMLRNTTSFPPAPFDQICWLEMLKLAGLKTDVSAETMLEFANQIALEARTGEATEHLLEQSRTLVTHLFKVTDLPSTGLLEKLADVAFVPTLKVNALMARLYPAYGQSRDGSNVTHYISFKDGIPADHEVLVWTSALLLPDWANPYRLSEHQVNMSDPSGSLESYRVEIGSRLGVDEIPRLQVVVEHVENICSVVIGKSDETHDLRSFMKTDVMTRVYKYLQVQLTDSSSGVPRDELQKTVHRLSEIPCIVSDLGLTFVRPKQVVISLYDDDQIFPYLNPMPTELGEFKRLFLHLGATVSATGEQYANVLESMYQQTGGEKLHPNEMRLAFKAVNGLFTNLKKHRHVDSLSRVNTVYLPTKIGHLFRSTEIVFNDNASLAERIRNLGRPFLVDLAECWLPSENQEDTVRLLPPRHRPAMLSVVVQEVLEERSRDTIVLHSVADKLKYQVNSKPFAQGLIRLIRSEHRKSGHRVRQTVLDSIEQHLRKIHVYGVEKVVTYLKHDGNRVTGSEMECECFVDKKQEDDNDGMESWNIYINKSIILNEELQVAVAEVICCITGGLLKHSIHYIQPILSCPPHSISKVLDRLKVPPDHSIADVQQSTLPAPGNFIPIEDHHLLKEDFEEFDMGEYVGFELDDDESGMPTVIYAVILERIEEEEFYHVRKLDSDEPAQCTAHRKLTQRYRINIGEDRQAGLALATDLYKFHRVDGLMSRSTSTSDQSGRRRTPSGGGNVASPKPNYRESFYHSSVFEAEENGSPSAARPFEEELGSRSSPATGVNGWSSGEQSNRRRPEASPSNGQFEMNSEDAETSNEDRSKIRSNGVERFRNHGEDHSRQDDFSDGTTTRYPQLPPCEPSSGKAQDFESSEFKAGFGQFDEEDMLNTEKTMSEVSDTLEEAWQLPDGQRKKIIKRLLLKWHPDKNIGNEMFATVIMQHIQSEIERLELGLPRPMNFDTSRFNFDPRNPFTSNETFQKNFASAYQYFFEQMNQRAKEHREQRERYQENFSREYSAGKDGYNFNVPPTFSSANPQPAQAKRFLRQAQEDLRAADNDYDGQDPAFEWACFKAHQAAEKALKAAQFAVDAVTSFSHDLVTLAASLEDVELRRLAQKLQKIVGNSNKLYNPDPIDFVVIPHEEYTREMACDAVMCSVDVLERVKEFIELRDST